MRGEDTRRIFQKHTKDYYLLSNEIRKAKFFSVLADKAAGCSNVEQLSLVICFVDETHCMREQFLGFLPFKRGLSGDAMVTTVIDFLCYQNVEIDDCRG